MESTQDIPVPKDNDSRKAREFPQFIKTGTLTGKATKTNIASRPRTRTYGS